MKRKVPLFVSLAVFVTTLLTFSACTSAAPTEVAQQAVPTAQPQSVEDFVAQQFTATAVAEQQIAATQTIQGVFEQALTATVNTQNTLSAAFSFALTATNQALIAPTETQAAIVLQATQTQIQLNESAFATQSAPALSQIQSWSGTNLTWLPVPQNVLEYQWY